MWLRGGKNRNMSLITSPFPSNKSDTQEFSWATFTGSLDSGYTAQGGNTVQCGTKRKMAHTVESKQVCLQSKTRTRDGFFYNRIKVMRGYRMENIEAGIWKSEKTSKYYTANERGGMTAHRGTTAKGTKMREKRNTTRLLFDLSRHVYFTHIDTTQNNECMATNYTRNRYIVTVLVEDRHEPVNRTRMTGVYRHGATHYNHITVVLVEPINTSTNKSNESFKSQNISHWWNTEFDLSRTYRMKSISHAQCRQNLPHHSSHIASIKMKIQNMCPRKSGMIIRKVCGTNAGVITDMNLVELSTWLTTSRILINNSMTPWMTPKKTVSKPTDPHEAALVPHTTERWNSQRGTVGWMSIGTLGTVIRPGGDCRAGRRRGRSRPGRPPLSQVTVRTCTGTVQGIATEYLSDTINVQVTY